MWKPSFLKRSAHLIGFLGGVPTNITHAYPVYLFGQVFVMGIGDSLSVLEGKGYSWINGLIEQGSMTRLEEGMFTPLVVREPVGIVVVSDEGSQCFTEAIPGWEERLDFAPVQARPARWVALPFQEVRGYLGNLAHRMSLVMDRHLRTATGDGTVERRVEAMGWAVWEGLSPSDDKHRRQIMVRIVAARRMRVDIAPAQIERMRQIAAKSIFLSVKDEVKRRGFGPEEQLRTLDELVDRYIERLRRTSDES